VQSGLTIYYALYRSNVVRHRPFGLLKPSRQRHYLRAKSSIADDKKGMGQANQEE
jgi:hypothetical protein